MSRERSTSHALDNLTGDRPVVSVIMANYQGAPHLVPALRSVAAQTLRQIEIIVSDDASTDDSVAIVRDAMAGDSRVRLITAERNGGPGRARNMALAASRGEWIAVVDSDDIVHPERLERLLAVARRADADLVADDLLFFNDGGGPTDLLLDTDQSFDVGPADWISAGAAGTPALGYLKPLIRSAWIAGLRYDETLRIGEDFDLVLRLLLQGARFRVVPQPWYLYRRHGGSISHRLSASTLAAMIDAHLRLVKGYDALPPAVQAALAERLKRLEGGLAYERLLAALKRGDVRVSAVMICGNPALFGRLAESAFDRARRRLSSGRLRISGAGVARPSRLYLSERRAPRPGGDDIFKAVPAYPPLGSTGLAHDRQLWKDLAAMSVDPSAIICDGPAARYAAGFIPAYIGGAQRIADQTWRGAATECAPAVASSGSGWGGK